MNGGHGEHGFTLIEVVLATALVAATATLVASVVQRANATRRWSSAASVAVAWASSEMELLRDAPPAPGIVRGEVSPDVTWVREVRPYPGILGEDGQPVLREVTLDVAWNQGRDRIHLQTLSPQSVGQVR